MSDIVGQLYSCAQELGRDDEETKIFAWHCGLLREAAREIQAARDFTATLSTALESKERLIAELVEALDECEDYFDNKADADHDETGFVPNKEMTLLSKVKQALKLADKHNPD